MAYAVTTPAVAGAEPRIWHLKGFDLFDGLSASELASLERSARVVELERGAILYLPGDKAERVFALRSGLIKLSAISPDGREATLALLESGEIFGELEVMEGRSRAHVASAYEDCTLFALPKKAFMTLMQRHTDFALRVNVHLGQRIREFHSKITCLLFKGAHSRLSELLLELAKRYGVSTPDGTRLKYRFSHRELAGLIGVTRETVSYTIAEFKREGLIATGGGRIILRQPEELENRV